MNVAYLPLLVTALSIIGAALVYGYQKQTDRRNTLIADRRECYQNLLTSLQNYLSTRDNKALLQFNMYRAEAFLRASDKVAMAIGKFTAANQHDIDKQSDLTAKTAFEAYCIMAREMRNDCFEKTELSDKQIKLAVPVSHSGSKDPK